MKSKIIAVVALIIVLTVPSYAKINVITSASNLADITRNIGGNLVTVTSLARPTEDIHFVEPRPSFITKLKNADMVVIYGMAFDQWMRTLIDNSRNSKIMPGGSGYVDASVGIKKREVPAGKIDMSMGEVHPLGNPHYLLDPENAKIVAKNILGGLIRVSPKDEDIFRNNYNRFIRELDAAIKNWKDEMRPHKGKPVVTYHKSWVYFTACFGLEDSGTIEPKPGIPPSPSHVSKLIQAMKKEKVKVILIETFYPRKFPEIIAKETGAKICVLPYEAGAIKGVNTYIGMMDYIVRKVSDALK
ncbi:MAG: metal ABC transporter substrate-binding protein [Armatimonadota bacterium]|nr:metal ABC transporter substrate-binding protein [Armatimonadota bacterium]